MPEAVKNTKSKPFASIMKSENNDKSNLKTSSGDKSRDDKNEQFLNELIRHYAELYGTGDLEVDIKKIRDMMNLVAYQESMYDPSDMSAYTNTGIINEKNPTRAKGKYHFKNDEVNTAIQRMHNNAQNNMGLYTKFNYIDKYGAPGNKLQVPFLNELKKHKNVNLLTETEQDIMFLTNLAQGDAPFSKFMSGEIDEKTLYFEGHFKGNASPEILTNYDIRESNFKEKNEKGNFDKEDTYNPGVQLDWEGDGIYDAYQKDEIMNIKTK